MSYGNLMTLGWFIVNILLPVVLPMIGLRMVSYFMPLNEAQLKRARIISTVEDGQLGWLAIAWSATAVYDSVSYMQDNEVFVSWIGNLLFAEFFVVSSAMFLAAGGAATSTEAGRTGRRHLTGSVIVTALSAGMLAMVHAAIQ
jgi:hypothetical protein